jgi:hypothetical protein
VYNDGRKPVNKEKISPEELTRLREVMEISDDNGERNPIDDSEVEYCLKFEYKILKIENKTDPDEKDKKLLQNVKYARKEKEKYVKSKREKNIEGHTHKKNGLWDSLEKVTGVNKNMADDMTGVKEEIKEIKEGIEEILKNF